MVTPGCKIYKVKITNERADIEPLFYSFKSEIEYYSKWEMDYTNDSEFTIENYSSSNKLTYNLLQRNMTGYKFRPMTKKYENWKQTETFLFPVSKYSMRDVQRIVNDLLIYINNETNMGRYLAIAYDWDVVPLSKVNNSSFDNKNEIRQMLKNSDGKAVNYRHVYISDVIKFSTSKDFIEVEIPFESVENYKKTVYIDMEKSPKVLQSILYNRYVDSVVDINSPDDFDPVAIFAPFGEIKSPLLSIRLSDKSDWDKLVMEIRTKSPFDRGGQNLKEVIFSFDFRVYCAKHKIPSDENICILFDLKNGYVGWAKDTTGWLRMSTFMDQNLAEFPLRYDYQSEVEFLNTRNITLNNGNVIILMSPKDVATNTAVIDVTEG